MAKPGNCHIDAVHNKPTQPNQSRISKHKHDERPTCEMEHAIVTPMEQRSARTRNAAIQQVACKHVRYETRSNRAMAKSGNTLTRLGRTSESSKPGAQPSAARKQDTHVCTRRADTSHNRQTFAFGACAPRRPLGESECW